MGNIVANVCTRIIISLNTPHLYSHFSKPLCLSVFNPFAIGIPQMVDATLERRTVWGNGEGSSGKRQLDVCSELPSQQGPWAFKKKVGVKVVFPTVHSGHLGDGT